MSQTMTHGEFEERIEAYLAGGLDAGEREAFDAHRVECSRCAAMLAEISGDDRRIGAMFADVIPMAGFEDRVVRRLMERRPGRMIHPAVRRAVSGLAAALVLGAMGYVGTRMIEDGRLPGMPAAKKTVVVAASSPGSPSTTTWMSDGDFDRMERLSDRAAPAKEAEKLLKEVTRNYTQWSAPADDHVSDKQAQGINGRFGREERGAQGRGFGDSLSDRGRSGEAAGGDPAAEGKRTGVERFISPHFGTNPAVKDGIQYLEMAQEPMAALRILDGTAAASDMSTVDAYIVPAPQVTPQNYFRLVQDQPAARNGGDAAGAELDRLGRTPGSTPDVRGTKLSVEFDTKAVAGKEVALAQTPRPPQSGQASAPAPAPDSPPATAQSQVMSRKIIRNGELEFEVDSFDSSTMQITKIVVEEGGFVSSTNSEKLPNGKVRGTVVVRVPPERLDTFVLKLRALGDLRSQKISAQDVTKQYYDLESELKAGRAMEERLLNIIKSGKGEIKDLLEAEKQLGVYREKIEKLEGEIRYYNNLVSFSTLSITVYERDIKTPAVAAQTEQVSMGIETDAVEKARLDAIKLIDEAKGRVIESQLKQHDAGQLAATIVCEVPPDAAGPLIDRLRQVGRVARLDVDRKQAARDGSAAPVRVERKDARFSISIYNLANVAPRQTTNLNMAVPDVEAAYRSILTAVTDRGGRIVTSSLNRQKPEQTTGSINFELHSAEAEAALTEIRRDREVMGLTVTENPDTQNVTTAKRGFVVQIAPLAVVPPRETEQLVLTARGDVAGTFRSLLDVLRTAEARILVSQLNEQEGAEVAGTLEVEVLRTKELDVRAALTSATDTISRSVSRSADAANTVDSKVRLNIRLMSLAVVPARETQSLAVAVSDVPAAFQSVVSALNEAGARVITSRLNQDDQRNVTGVLDFEVMRDKRDGIEKALAGAGTVYSRSITRAAETQNSVESKVRLVVTLNNVGQLPARERTRLMLEVNDVEAQAAAVINAAEAAGGRTLEQTHSKATDGRMSSHLVVEVPLTKAEEVRRQVRGLGIVRVVESSSNPQAPAGQVARAHLDVTLASPDLLVGSDEGLTASLRHAVATSLKGLLWSLQFIVVGLLFVGPWALLIWMGWRVLRRSRSAPQPMPA